ncbi:hypothetical protein MG296_06980 [Flavobacteriaceae bacterium TK19130]|nr:hypothetical protein [Thermobacterium salinum]
MKTIITIAICLFTFTGVAQNQYEKGMQKAFELWQENKPLEAANLFERIGNAESDKWLPYYYASQIYILQSFNEKDETALKAKLETALNFLNDAKTNSDNNPYVMTLEALYYTAWIAYDGQKYGMKYAGKVTQLYEKAIAISPENPIFILAKAEWEIGSAKYFGQPLDPYCKDIQRAIDLFATFEPEGQFYPSYGAERAPEVLEMYCK